MSEPVRVETKEGVARVTLDRPEARNALSRALRSALCEAFERLREDGSVGAVILTGADPAFCAGLDLKELGGETEAPGGAGDATATGGDLIQTIEAFDRPVIGAINGVAITGGFELALACDLLIASEHARFADTHARVCILPGWGLSQKLPRLIGMGRAKELSFTGNYLDAETACAWGLANRVVAPEELLPACEALAQDMLSCEPKALAGYKRLIDEGFAMSYGDGLRHESEVCIASSEQVSAEELAGRRAEVQSRGRRQADR